MPSFVVDALDVQTELRRPGSGEEVVHLETHTALGIHPTPLSSSRVAMPLIFSARQRGQGIKKR